MKWYEWAIGIALSIAFVFGLVTYKHKPDFYINGVPYYTTSNCVKSELVYKFELYYGYNFYTGKYENIAGYHWVNECVESKIDTIEIKPDK